MRLFWRKGSASGSAKTFWRGKSLMEVGRFTYGHEKARVLEWGEGRALRIGSFCSISAGVSFFLGGEHRTDWVSTFPFGHVFCEELDLEKPPAAGHPASKGDISVGNDVWIGRGATILSGVTVGDGAVIGASAVVSADVPPYAIAAGNPARVLRRRFSPEIIELLLKLRWWDLSLEAVREVAPLLSAEPDARVLETCIQKYSSKPGH